MTLEDILWWGFSSENLGSMVYVFIEFITRPGSDSTSKETVYKWYLCNITKIYMWKVELGVMTMNLCLNVHQGARTDASQLNTSLCNP